eukprot:1192276-Prorocentrum_minimum.AAC.1
MRRGRGGEGSFFSPIPTISHLDRRERESIDEAAANGTPRQNWPINAGVAGINAPSLGKSRIWPSNVPSNQRSDVQNWFRSTTDNSPLTGGALPKIPLKIPPLTASQLVSVERTRAATSNPKGYDPLGELKRSRFFRSFSKEQQPSTSTTV